MSAPCQWLRRARAAQVTGPVPRMQLRKQRRWIVLDRLQATRIGQLVQASAQTPGAGTAIG